MLRENGLKLFGIQCAGFNELEQPSFVFCATGLERNRGQMYGGENVRGHAIDVNRHGIAQRFFEQQASSWKELHRPISDNDEFVLHRAAAGFEIIENRFEANE